MLHLAGYNSWASCCFFLIFFFLSFLFSLLKDFRSFKITEFLKVVYCRCLIDRHCTVHADDLKEFTKLFILLLLLPIFRFNCLLLVVIIPRTDCQISVLPIPVSFPRYREN